ncbi:MAG: GntR family transcriptional regulator [Sphingomonadaceae bacterium]
MPKADGPAVPDEPATRSFDLAPFHAQPAVALHHQIKEDLVLHLRSEHFAPGVPLPSEAELCAHYRVSRGTLRRALADLVSDGYLERHRGRGTFVTRSKLESGVIGAYNRFHLVGPPLDAVARVLQCRRVRASRDIGAMLDVKTGTPLWILERVRFTQGTPVGLQTSFLPFDLCPGLARQNLAALHLIDLLRDAYGVHLGSAIEYVEPTVADGYAARHLGVRLRTPLFQVERTTYTVAGVIAEYRRGVLRGDIYRYRIELR